MREIRLYMGCNFGQLALDYSNYQQPCCIRYMGGAFDTWRQLTFLHHLHGGASDTWRQHPFCIRYMGLHQIHGDNIRYMETTDLFALDTWRLIS